MGDGVVVAAKILATSEISTFLVFKQGAFYHSNGYSCSLFSSGTQKIVADVWGSLLDHIFFFIFVFCGLIRFNEFDDSPLSFVNTLL